MELVITGCIALVVCAFISFILGIIYDICGISVVSNSNDNKFLYYLNNGVTVTGIAAVIIAVVGITLYILGMTVTLLLN